MERLDGFGCCKKRERRKRGRRVVRKRKDGRAERRERGRNENEPKEISTLEDLTTTLATSSRGMARRFAEEEELGEAGVIRVDGGAVKSLIGAREEVRRGQYASKAASKAQ